jgi:hypothetical protein
MMKNSYLTQENMFYVVLLAVVSFQATVQLNENDENETGHVLLMNT